MRKPCPACNLSGNAEYPGQLVSFTSSIPCSCGDGFVDVVDEINIVLTDGEGACGIHPPHKKEYLRNPCSDIPPRAADMLMTLAPASKKAPILWASKLREACEKTKDSFALLGVDLAINEVLRDEQVIPTGIPALDKIIGGGWRPGINIAFGKSLALNFAHQAASPYLMITAWPSVERQHLILGREKFTMVRGFCLTNNFTDLLSAIKKTSHKLVIVDDYGAYCRGDYKVKRRQAHELHAATKELGVSLVLCGEKPQRFMEHTDQGRIANIVIERRGEGLRTHYVAHKSRWCQPKQVAEDPEEPCWTAAQKTQNDINITITGAVGSGKSALVDLITCALREYGLEAEVRGEDRPSSSFCEPLGMRMAAIAKRCRITIDHKQAPRRSVEQSDETSRTKTKKEPTTTKG